MQQVKNYIAVNIDENALAKKIRVHSRNADHFLLKAATLIFLLREKQNAILISYSVIKKRQRSYEYKTVGAQSKSNFSLKLSDKMSYTSGAPPPFYHKV